MPNTPNLADTANCAAPQPDSRPAATAFFEENKVLLMMLFVVLLLAAVSYLVGEWNELEVHKRELHLVSELRTSEAPSNEDLALRLQTELQTLNHREFWGGLSHHLSLAFLVSFITIVAVEFHTRKQMRKDLDEHLEEVKQNVWQALGKRLLGSKIAAEIEAIMKEDAAKAHCSYVITFKPPREGVQEDRVIVLIENFYKIRNLAGMAGREHRVRNSISAYEKTGPFPRFIRFDINEQSQITTAVSKDILEHTVKLPVEADARVSVAVAMEIVYKLRDAETFITDVAAEELHITVSNQVPDKIRQFSVDLIHGSGRLEHPVEGSWYLGRALLPGQGFALNWRDALDVTTTDSATTNHVATPTS